MTRVEGKWLAAFYATLLAMCVLTAAAGAVFGFTFAQLKNDGYDDGFEAGRICGFQDAQDGVWDNLNVPIRDIVRCR